MININFPKGTHLELPFQISSLTFELEGTNLIITLPDGSQVFVTDFTTALATNAAYDLDIQDFDSFPKERLPADYSYIEFSPEMGIDTVLDNFAQLYDYLEESSAGDLIANTSIPTTFYEEPEQPDEVEHVPGERLHREFRNAEVTWTTSNKPQDDFDVLSETEIAELTSILEEDSFVTLSPEVLDTLVEELIPEVDNILLPTEDTVSLEGTNPNEFPVDLEDVLIPDEDEDIEDYLPEPKEKHANNGFGNGDQEAPGNSKSHNNAENSDRVHHNPKFQDPIDDFDVDVDLL